MKKKYAKIEVFKPGTHTTMHGETIIFTEADLDATAKAYDPEKFEAPFVVGHPKTDAPAYGWAKAVNFADGKLSVEADQVEPQFAEMVKAGRFKKVSARFYRPESPDNPVPGTWYLRHVGFLGAAAPAVKGLKPAAFAEDEEGTVTVEFGETNWGLRDIASMFRRVREMFIEKFGGEAADKVLPSWQIEELEDAARRQTDETAIEPAFSQTNKEDYDVDPKDLKKREDELEQRETEFSEKEKKFKEQEQRRKQESANARKAEAVAFCEGLVKDGKLLPAQKDRVVAFMTGLSAETTVEFGEGDGKKSETQLAAFKAIAKDMPKVVEFGEVAVLGLGEPAADGKQEVVFGEDITAHV